MTITPALLKEARTLLGMSQNSLAGRVGVSDGPIGNYERGAPASPKLDLALVKTALEEAGVEFVTAPDGAPGVRLRKAKP